MDYLALFFAALAALAFAPPLAATKLHAWGVTLLICSAICQLVSLTAHVAHTPFSG